MARKKKKKTKLTAHYKKIMALLSLICAVYFSVYYPELLPEANVSSSVSEETDFSGEASVEVNGNKPTFTEDEIVDQSFEKYGEQDSLGRCTTAVACVGQDIMPTEKRESIARIKPTGWKQNKTGWWYSLEGRSYLFDTWKKVDGRWYYFKADGYAAANEFVRGWWCNSNCVQNDPVKYSWHKNSRGWWYGVTGGWYAKNATYIIDGVAYTFDKDGYCTNP